MCRNALQIGLVACALVACAGCHGMLNNRYQPLDHDHHWDPILGSCDTCGVCGGAFEGHTPSSYAKHMLTCASGGGEIYWGEWISDPPDPHDPCDDCGNWVGPQPGPPTFWQSLTYGWCNLWGIRSAGYGYDAEVVDIDIDVDFGVPMTEPLQLPVISPDTQGPATEAGPGDDRLDPPASIPDRQATLESSPRPLWRARPISFQVRKRGQDSFSGTAPTNLRSMPGVLHK